MHQLQDTEEIVQQVEPTRRTFLHALLNNLREANRTIYVHRLIYVGEHTFPDTPNFNVQNIMKSIIDTVNYEYNDEYLSGVLLYYPKYFCHLLEGSEDSIIKHLMLLTEKEEFKINLGRMKMLVCYHHINQRFLNRWIALTNKPPTLLERLDPEQTELNKCYRYNFDCIQKLYKLADVTKNNAPIEMDCLPEYGLIEFLLSSKYIIDLYDYYNLYGVIPVRDGLKDLVWPAMSEFVPFHVFDEPIDPVTDLPIVEHPTVEHPPEEAMLDE